MSYSIRMRKEARKARRTGRQIERFVKRFEEYGEAHFYLALHAAFPLILTPDLVYRIWVNFDRDVHNRLLEIPWIATADLLLSDLCREVGYELYEMQAEVRAQLLDRFSYHPRFTATRNGQVTQRLDELAKFLEEYSIHLRQNRFDPNAQTLADVHLWTALSHSDPDRAAREMTAALTRGMEAEDNAEILRMTDLTGELATRHEKYKPLLIYLRGVEEYALGNNRLAAEQLAEVDLDQFEALGIELTIPEIVEPELEVTGIKYVTAESGLNLRVGPGKEFQIIKTLEKGTAVGIVTEDEWAHVHVEDEYGYVVAEFLSAEQPAATAELETDEVLEAQFPEEKDASEDGTPRSGLRRRRGKGLDERELYLDVFVERIRAGRCVPLISDALSSGSLAGSESYARQWAEEIGYPFAVDEAEILPRVAQFLSAEVGNVAAKERYLEFVKVQLLKSASRDPDTPEELIDELLKERDRLNVSEVAKEVVSSRLFADPQNPLRLLAKMPLSVYITTGYITSMEDALRSEGREPQTELCHWLDELNYLAPSIFERDSAYEPSAEAPLVYHLYGLDSVPESLVLSEDDYVEFLMALGADPDRLPLPIRATLANASILSLGYAPNALEFKVLHHTLLSDSSIRRRESLFTYLSEPNDQVGVSDFEAWRTYVSRYFERDGFGIYWGSVDELVLQLWEAMKHS